MTLHYRVFLDALLRRSLDNPTRYHSTKTSADAIADQSTYIQASLGFSDLNDLYNGAPVDSQLAQLHAALAPYIDLQKLRTFVAHGDDLYSVLCSENPPIEVLSLLDLLTALLRPQTREKIRSPSTIAGLLMVEMAYLDQEELRTVLLDTKNQIQDIVTVYRGSVNTSIVRIGEVYKAALRRNSTGIIVVHNHPSGDPEPSPEDVLVTREIVEAGKLLDVECLDHLVIGQGRWISMRARGLGFGR